MKISEATKLSIQSLHKLGFSDDEAKLITRNLIEAELVEKKSHGLVRIPAFKNKMQTGIFKIVKEDIELVSEFKGSLFFDAKYKTGFYAIYKSLDKAIEKAKITGMVGVAIKDMSYASGYIGDFARIAAENDLIYIGFHNSNGSLIPHGTIKEMWGTNPITVGIPTNSAPVILDMASSKCTIGDLIIAKNEGKEIPEGYALDEEGNITIDPVKALEGGLLPIAGHKGSGLAFIVELLAGGLSNSRVGGTVKGGWGSFYMLIDPTMFRSLKEFKAEIEMAIDELKNAPKAKGFTEVYFPGEQSYLKRQKNLERGEIDVDEKLLKEINNLSL